MKLVPKLRRSIIGESIFSLTATSATRGREFTFQLYRPSYSIEKRVRKMLLVSRVKEVLRRSFRIEIRIVWEERFFEKGRLFDYVKRNESRQTSSATVWFFNVQRCSPTCRVYETSLKFPCQVKNLDRWDVISRNACFANEFNDKASWKVANVSRGLTLAAIIRGHIAKHP